MQLQFCFCIGDTMGFHTVAYLPVTDGKQALFGRNTIENFGKGTALTKLYKAKEKQKSMLSHRF